MFILSKNLIVVLQRISVNSPTFRAVWKNENASVK